MLKKFCIGWVVDLGVIVYNNPPYKSIYIIFNSPYIFNSPASLNMKILKTQLCVFHARGECTRGVRCSFAHNIAELRERPDFKKSKLCYAYCAQACYNPYCNFAHGEAELQPRDKTHKKALCKLFAQGNCRDGVNCTYAHSVEEVSTKKIYGSVEIAAATAAATTEGTKAMGRGDGYRRRSLGRKRNVYRPGASPPKQLLATQLPVKASYRSPSNEELETSLNSRDLPPSISPVMAPRSSQDGLRTVRRIWSCTTTDGSETEEPKECCTKRLDAPPQTPFHSLSGGGGTSTFGTLPSLVVGSNLRRDSVPFVPKCQPSAVPIGPPPSPATCPPKLCVDAAPPILPLIVTGPLSPNPIPTAGASSLSYDLMYPSIPPPVFCAPNDGCTASLPCCSITTPSFLVKSDEREGPNGSGGFVIRRDRKSVV